MIVIYDKQTLKVIRIMNKEPIALTDNLGLARCETIPQGDNFTVANIQTHTESWTEKKTVYELDDGTQYNTPQLDLDTDEYYPYTEKEIEIVKTREYQTCDLVPKIYTQTEINNKKAKEYEALVERFLRQKYSLSNELAILRQASTKPEEYAVYNAYAEECKAKAKEIIYGGE